MKNHIILRVVSRFLIPFILLYALYIQMHGEYSPGGGFQAGVIFASAFILYSLIWGIDSSYEIICDDQLRILASLGVLLYAGVGVVTLFMGGNFLDYSVLLNNPVSGQKLGIMLVEVGVGVTVFAVMLLMFYLFVERNEE